DTTTATGSSPPGRGRRRRSRRAGHRRKTTLVRTPPSWTCCSVTWTPARGRRQAVMTGGGQWNSPPASTSRPAPASRSDARTSSREPRSSTLWPRIQEEDSMPRRYAVIGLGHRAQLYVDALLGDWRDAGELVAFCDVNRTRMEYYNDRAEAAGFARVPCYH